MGLFNGSSSAVELNPEYKSTIVASTSSSEKWITKLLGKCQAQLDFQLEGGETVGALYGSDISELFVVTNRRLLRLKKNKESWPAIALSEIAKVELGQKDLGSGQFRYLIMIDTVTSAAYAERDRRRFLPQNFILIESQEPNDPTQLAARIEAARASV